jgi:hypothetical protein
MPRSLQQRARRVRVLAACTLLVIVGATVAIELTITRALVASRDGLVQAEDTLTQASELATSTAGVADRISTLAGRVGNGLGSSAQALDATGALARSVGQLIEVLSSVSSKVRAITDDLGVTEQTLKDVQAQLVTSASEVRAALPGLQESAASLKALPQRLTDARTNLASSRRSLDPVGNLARLAVGLVGLALLGVVLVVSESALLTARARAG